MVQKIQKPVRAIRHQLCEIQAISLGYRLHQDQTPNVIRTQIKNAFPKEAYHHWATAHTVGIPRAMYVQTIKLSLTWVCYLFNKFPFSIRIAYDYVFIIQI